MRKAGGSFGAVALLCATAWPLSAAAQWVVASDAQGEYVRGRVLVAPRAGVSDASLQTLLGQVGGRVHAIGRSGAYIVDLPAQASETAVQQRLAHDPRLKFAELDRRIKPAFTPNDPYMSSAWHAIKIGATTAWDYAQGSGVTIAVLDSGVDSSQPDLAGKLVPGWNFYDNNSNTSDVTGHGTGVAGIASADTNNGVGIAAISGQAMIMPLRICDTSGYASWSTVAQAITYAADHGARVANISFSNMAGSSTVQTAAQYMKGKNGLVVVAAGNTGANEGFAQTTTMIPVSATDQNDVITSFSSYGPYVAMSAPGVNVPGTNVGGSYAYWYGTSVSSPIVAAVIADMMSANPALPNTQVESLLYSTAVDLGAAGRDIYYGYGRVNAAGAVTAAAAAKAPAADTTAPTVAIGAPTAGSSVSGLVAVNVSASDNVGVAKVVLTVNGATLATDTASPYGFSWDSTMTPNGTVNLVAYAYDAAGNVGQSAPVSVTVSNTSVTVAADTTPPVVQILSPASGAQLSNRNTTVSASATDNSGTSGITQQLYIDGALKATAAGGSLSYSWNTRKLASGSHTVQVVATDAAGNRSSVSEQVTK